MRCISDIQRNSWVFGRCRVAVVSTRMVLCIVHFVQRFESFARPRCIKFFSQIFGRKKKGVATNLSFFFFFGLSLRVLRAELLVAIGDCWQGRMFMPSFKQLCCCRNTTTRRRRKEKEGEGMRRKVRIVVLV